VAPSALTCPRSPSRRQLRAAAGTVLGRRGRRPCPTWSDRPCRTSRPYRDCRRHRTFPVSPDSPALPSVGDSVKPLNRWGFRPSRSPSWFQSSRRGGFGGRGGSAGFVTVGQAGVASVAASVAVSVAAASVLAPPWPLPPRYLPPRPLVRPGWRRDPPVSAVQLCIGGRRRLVQPASSRPRHDRIERRAHRRRPQRSRRIVGPVAGLARPAALSARRSVGTAACG
jgi:hypothetical protein